MSKVAFRIKQGETKVGKQPGVNKLVLKSPNVSRQQCVHCARSREA